MNGITATGRGLMKPTVSVDAAPDDVIIRIDCAENYEYWTEVRISRAKLMEMVEAIDLVGAVDAPPTPAGWTTFDG